MTDFVAHYLDASALETSGRQSGRGKGPRCAQEILLRTINLRSSNEFWIGAATRTIFLTLPDHRVEWKRPICFKLDASPFVRTISHPRLKTPMRLVDHLYFVAEHDDHHLSRIWELVTTKP